MASEGTQQINFRAGDLAPELAARADGRPWSYVARCDLARYYALLARCTPAFPEPEASLLVDALNGLAPEPRTAHLLWAQIEDARREGLAEKWGADGPALVERLRALTPFEAWAVQDAAARFWSLAPAGLPLGDALRRVGLVR